MVEIFDEGIKSDGTCEREGSKAGLIDNTDRKRGIERPASVGQDGHDTRSQVPD